MGLFLQSDLNSRANKAQEEKLVGPTLDNYGGWQFCDFGGVADRGWEWDRETSYLLE